MKKRIMPVEKTTIQRLSGDELELLVKFKNSNEYTLLKKISEEEKYKRYKDNFYTVNNMEEIQILRGVNAGLDFILDVVDQAKEELRNRGDKEVEIDTE